MATEDFNTKIKWSDIIDYAKNKSFRKSYNTLYDTLQSLGWGDFIYRYYQDPNFGDTELLLPSDPPAAEFDELPMEDNISILLSYPDIDINSINNNFGSHQYDGNGINREDLIQNFNHKLVDPTELVSEEQKSAIFNDKQYSLIELDGMASLNSNDPYLRKMKQIMNKMVSGKIYLSDLKGYINHLAIMLAGSTMNSVGKTITNINENSTPGGNCWVPCTFESSCANCCVS